MIVVEAVVLRELQSKLYGVACNHVPAPSLAPAIVRLPATHSAHELFVNVNVGPVLSIFIVLPVVVVRLDKSAAYHVYL